MDTTGEASNLKPEGHNPEVAGDSRPELSVSLNRQRAQSTLRMDVPGFETMRLVSPTHNDIVEKSERPSSGTFLPLFSPPSYNNLRSAMVARYSSSKKPNPLLDTLSPSGQKAFKEVMEEFEFEAGVELELDSSDIAGLYFIQEGSVEIEHIFPERTPHQCESRVSGEFFGEHVVLDGSRRMTLRIFEDTNGIWIPESRFAYLIEAEPSFLLNLTRTVIRRQSEYDDRVIDKLSEANKVSKQQIERLQEVSTSSKAINSASSLDDLLQVILREASKLVGAEGGNIYLVDWDAHEIFSFVEENGQTKKVSLPIGTGSVGLAVERGVTINVKNAYEDMSFDTSIDFSNGIRAGSVLSTPLRNPKGDIVGAIQLMRKVETNPFNTKDEEMIASFGVHAAIAIETAQHLEKLSRSHQLDAVGNFAASIVQDLKSPLTVIQGYVDLLNFTMSSPEQRSHLVNISQQMRRIVGMTQEVLDFALGHLRLNPTKTEVIEYLGDVCDKFRTEINQYNIEFSFECDEAEEWTVLLDTDRFTRVFHSLLRNARESMPDGGLLTVRAYRDEKAWELQIRDTGVGISAAQLDTIFQPFTKFGKNCGAGLGLSIARNVIKEHGGEITVDSELGSGTTVFIRMPKHPRMTNGQDIEPIALDSVTSIASLVEKATALSGNIPSLN